MWARAPRAGAVEKGDLGDIGFHRQGLTRKSELDGIPVRVQVDQCLTVDTDLLEVVEDRHARAATVLTSQFPTKLWHADMGEPTLADALCDRLFHHAFKIEMRGDSLRKSNDGKKI